MGLAVALIAYNNLLNLWRPFHRFYVPINLCAAAGVIGLALGLLNLRDEALGLTADTLSEAARFALAGLIITGPLYVALLSPRWAKLIADRRLEDSSRLEMLYRIFIRIPIGTVLLEEVAFRGVLFVLLVQYGALTAALISSVAFALWHVVPTLAAARVNRILNGFTPWRAMTGGVVATFGIGMILVWLRIQTGGLGAPFGIHAAVNSSATLAGFLALRKSGAGRI
jgi:membrane protease YdiL (CAAX protease family)